MKVTINGIERDIRESRWPEYEAAGWKPVAQEQAGEDIVRLKPPVKPKATETALEEAKTNLEGDE